MITALATVTVGIASLVVLTGVVIVIGHIAGWHFTRYELKLAVAAIAAGTFTLWLLTVIFHLNWTPS